MSVAARTALLGNPLGAGVSTEVPCQRHLGAIARVGNNETRPLITTRVVTLLYGDASLCETNTETHQQQQQHTAAS